MEFFINIFLPAYGPEYQEYFLGVKADKRPNFMCRLSWNLAASNSKNPQGCPGLCRDYFTFIHICHISFPICVKFSTRNMKISFQYRVNCKVLPKTLLHRDNNKPQGCPITSQTQRRDVELLLYPYWALELGQWHSPWKKPDIHCTWDRVGAPEHFFEINEEIFKEYIQNCIDAHTVKQYDILKTKKTLAAYAC